jgi:hypothetical protein
LPSSIENITRCRSGQQGISKSSYHGNNFRKTRRRTGQTGAANEGSPFRGLAFMIRKIFFQAGWLGLNGHCATRERCFDCLEQYRPIENIEARERL